MTWNEGVADLEKLVERAATFFDLGAVKRVDRLGGNANKNYVIVADSGEYVCKFIVEHPIENLLSEVRYLDRIREYSFPAGYYLAAEDGSRIFQAEDVLVVMLPLLAGQCPALNETSVRRVGEALAQLHLIPVAGLPFRSNWLRPTYFQETMPLIKEYFPAESRIVEELYEAVKSFPYDSLPKTIVHGDMNPWNCLFDHDQLVAFIDWEEVGICPAILDIALAIQDFCFVEGAFMPNLYSAMIAAYETVRPLTQAEKDVMKIAIQYTGLSWSIWWLLKFGHEYPDAEKVKEWPRYLTLHLNNLELPQIP
jgi:homoserine kinase type II